MPGGPSPEGTDVALSLSQIRGMLGTAALSPQSGSAPHGILSSKSLGPLTDPEIQRPISVAWSFDSVQKPGQPPSAGQASGAGSQGSSSAAEGGLLPDIVLPLPADVVDAGQGLCGRPVCVCAWARASGSVGGGRVSEREGALRTKGLWTNTGPKRVLMRSMFRVRKVLSGPGPQVSQSKHQLWGSAEHRRTANDRPTLLPSGSFETGGTILALRLFSLLLAALGLGSGEGGLGWVGTGPHTGGDCRPAHPSLRGTGPKSCAVRFQGGVDWDSPHGPQSTAGVR